MAINIEANTQSFKARVHKLVINHNEETQKQYFAASTLKELIKDMNDSEVVDFFKPLNVKYSEQDKIPLNAKYSEQDKIKKILGNTLGRKHASWHVWFKTLRRSREEKFEIKAKILKDRLGFLMNEMKKTAYAMEDACLKEQAKKIVESISTMKSAIKEKNLFKFYQAKENYELEKTSFSELNEDNFSNSDRECKTRFFTIFSKMVETLDALMKKKFQKIFLYHVGRCSSFLKDTQKCEAYKQYRIIYSSKYKIDNYSETKDFLKNKFSDDDDIIKTALLQRETEKNNLLLVDVTRKILSSKGLVPYQGTDQSFGFTHVYNKYRKTFDYITQTFKNENNIFDNDSKAATSGAFYNFIPSVDIEDKWSFFNGIFNALETVVTCMCEESEISSSRGKPIEESLGSRRI